MPQKNVETVERAVEAWNADDLAEALEAAGLSD